MEKKERWLGRVLKHAVEIAVGLVGVVSIMVTMVYIKISDSSLKSFICIVIAILTILSINSAVIYKKEIAVTSKEKHMIVIRIIWDYTIWIILIILYYKTRFCTIIPGDNSYWVYNILTVYTIISVALKYLFKFLQEKKETSAEGKISIFAQCVIALWFAWLIIYFNTSVCYWLYIPPKGMDLSNALKPFSMSVYKHSYIKTDLLSNNSHKYIRSTIKEDKLLEKFINEISNKTTERIRGVEYIHHVIREKYETYFIVNPEYKDSNGNDVERPYDFDKMYFYEFRMYENGQIILVKYRQGFNFLVPAYHEDLYKLNISPELVEQLLF